MKKSAPTSIRVSVAEQILTVIRGGKTLRSFSISTSRFGVGFDEGSFKTPLGDFRIAEKIGAGEPPGTVFQSRKPIGLKISERESDAIMSRILWLEGLDPENANTHARYVYIHGTNQEKKIGRPASDGCVRMRNADIVDLFDLVEVGTLVRIISGRRKNQHKKTARKSLRGLASAPKRRQQLAGKGGEELIE